MGKTGSEEETMSGDLQTGFLLQRSLRVGWAVARTAWRSRYNRLWRFSKFKWVVVMQIVQLAFFWWLSSRTGKLAGASHQERFVGILALLVLQFGWSGLLQGFVNGQFQLFKGSLNPLFEVSSAPPIGFIIGRVLEHIPRRIWSSLLWAWAYTAVLPPKGRIADLLMLSGIATVIASLAFLTGMLSLILWQAYAPKTVRYGLTGGLVLQIIFMTWAAIFLAQGGTVAQILQTLAQSRHVLFTLVVMIGALPGIGMLGTSLVRPQVIDRLYHRGLKQLTELEQGIGKAKRSFYVELAGDPLVRAIVSREWISLLRAPFTGVRLFAYSAAIVGEWITGRSLHHHTAGGSHSAVLLLGIPLVAWVLIFSGDFIMAFPGEGAALTLYRLSGHSASRVMAAKFLANWLPNCVLIFVACLAGAIAAKDAIGEPWRIVANGLLAATASMMGAFGISAGYLDPDLDELGQAQNSPGTGQMGAWGLVGLVAACIPIVLILFVSWPGTAAVVPLPVLFWIIVCLPIGIWWWGKGRLRNRFKGKR
jgi:hypothetical protein